ncbi:DUF7793 family protein [Crocinitomix algicola]|uniref:DUF7793 family protein n=1 Tax=Crocinitomix algicola TaxID=1740263 RepID=UPI0008305467|nr:hypothetical protein [Crocinitomix algicola]
MTISRCDVGFMSIIEQETILFHVYPEAEVQLHHIEDLEDLVRQIEKELRFKVILFFNESSSISKKACQRYVQLVSKELVSAIGVVVSDLAQNVIVRHHFRPLTRLKQFQMFSELDGAKSWVKQFK